MFIRDEEIKRIILYLKALGAKVVIRDYVSDHSGETIFEPKYTININKRRHNSKIELIMTLLHEAAHLKYAIVNKCEFSDSFLIDVWNLEEQNKTVPKNVRRDIVKFELNSLELMPEIAQELNLKIPMYKILINKESDQFTYRYFDLHGKFPTYKLEQENMKKLKEKYKR